MLRPRGWYLEVSMQKWLKQPTTKCPKDSVRGIIALYLRHDRVAERMCGVGNSHAMGARKDHSRHSHAHEIRAQAGNGDAAAEPSSSAQYD